MVINNNSIKQTKEQQSRLAFKKTPCFSSLRLKEKKKKKNHECFWMALCEVSLAKIL